MRLARRFKRGRYIGFGENRWSAVHFDDLADLYSLALKKAASRTMHAASENFSMKELVKTIHRGLGFKGEPSSLTLKEARRFSPIADALIQSHALSSEVARALGWQPSRGSIMKEVEQKARENAFLSRVKLPRIEGAVSDS
jgi:nucleoside-diphosphate-sugar epimerase